MDHDTLVRLLGFVSLLLGGGLVGVLLRHRYQMAKLRQEGLVEDHKGDVVTFQTIMEEMKVQRDDARLYAERLEERLQNMEAEIQGLRLARDLDPFPNWIVDRTGECIFVNREFERHFLEPSGRSYRDAIGKTVDTFGWPKAFTDILQTLNLAAQSRPDGTARATTTLDVPRLGKSKITVHKFPIRFKPSGIIVAYAGYITDLEPVNELLGRQEA